MGEGSLEPRQQFRSRDVFAFVKFLLPVAWIVAAPGGADNPSARAAFEVQEKLADTIGLLIRSPSDVFISQRFQTPLNLWKTIRH